MADKKVSTLLSKDAAKTFCEIAVPVFGELAKRAGLKLEVKKDYFDIGLDKYTLTIDRLE